MNPQRFVLFLLLVFCFATGHAYELATHGRLTEQAFLKSNLVQDSQLLLDLGLDNNSINPFGTAYYDVSGSVVSERVANIFERDRMRDPNEANTIKGWLMRGAIREDDYPGADNGQPQDDPLLFRPVNHFYDPVFSRGLTSTILGVPVPVGDPAPKWAIGSTDVLTSPNTPNTNRGNHYSVFDAREAMYRALTGKSSQGSAVAATQAERNKYWATTFRALGDTVHLLQDMGQPQHTRNDPHAGKKYDSDSSYKGHKSVFENYIEARATNQVFATAGSVVSTPSITVIPIPLTYTGYPVPAFTNYLSFFTTPSAGGIPARKGLADYSNRGFFSAGKNLNTNEYSYPSNNPYDYNRQASLYVDWSGNPLPGNSSVTLLMGSVPDTLNPAMTASSVPLTTEGIWDQFLVQKDGTHAYTLNRYNYDAMADLLIPRSVAYSAGLINYFFRGKMDMIWNSANPDANECLIRNLGNEPMDGSFELYDKNRGIPLITWNMHIEPGASSLPLDMSSLVTAQNYYTAMDVMLVFKGVLGQEAQAVVGKKGKMGLGYGRAYAIGGSPYSGWIYTSTIEESDKVACTYALANGDTVCQEVSVHYPTYPYGTDAYGVLHECSTGGCVPDVRNPYKVKWTCLGTP